MFHSAQLRSHVMGGVRVLPAEDDPLLAMELEDALLDARARVVGPFAALAALLAAVETGEFDAAILDVRLGRSESFPAAEKLAAKGAPVIFHPGRLQDAQIATRFPNARLCSQPCCCERMIETLARTMVEVKRGCAARA
ncbi:MAG: response regulator [Rhizobiales bacterium]|nr:response regulator [Hyphomicrobiales bacterium]